VGLEPRVAHHAAGEVGGGGAGRDAVRGDAARTECAAAAFSRHVTMTSTPRSASRRAALRPSPRPVTTAMREGGAGEVYAMTAFYA
jgi:hypothetical protein